MKKKLKFIVPIVLLIIAAIVGVLYFMKRGGSASGEVAYVDKVSAVNFASTPTSYNRFAGVVESQQTVDFKKDGNREILEVYVKEGDNIQKDAKLFRYDVRSSENGILEANLEIEGLNSELAIYRANNSTENQILARQTEISIQKKQAEIAAYQQEIDNADVLSSLTGVVKEVNEEGLNNEGMEAPIVKVMEVGEYRVKGKIDEQLFGMVNVGDPVIVRSRVDESLTWSGTVSKIETEPQQSSENNYYGGETGEKASSYPFYVTLDNIDNLMLGQHVFVEPGADMDVSLSGIWLMSDYLMVEEDGYYVYVAENNKLTKRKVEVGEINEEMFITEIVGNLSNDDLIAWPDESYTEGMNVLNVAEAME